MFEKLREKSSLTFSCVDGLITGVWYMGFGIIRQHYFWDTDPVVDTNSVTNPIIKRRSEVPGRLKTSPVSQCDLHLSRVRRT